MRNSSILYILNYKEPKNLIRSKFVEVHRYAQDTKMVFLILLRFQTKKTIILIIQ